AGICEAPAGTVTAEGAASTGAICSFPNPKPTTPAVTTVRATRRGCMGESVVQPVTQVVDHDGGRCQSPYTLRWSMSVQRNVRVAPYGDLPPLWIGPQALISPLSRMRITL